MVGISVATTDESWYFPMRHLSGGNLDPDHVISWARDLAKEERHWCGANLQYELEWLESEDIILKGKFLDVQIAQALIDEEQPSMELGILCNQYLGTSKDEALLIEAAKDAGVDPKGGLWKLHSKYVGPYASYDTKCVLEILDKQLKEIEKQELQEIFSLECKVLPILWQMRKRGFRVDLDKASDLSLTLLTKEKNLRKHIREKYDCNIDEWSGPMIGKVCDRLKILYPRSPKGQPSFTGDWLEDHDHPFLKSVAELRELNRLRDTFIDNWMFSNHINGVIHPQWKQLKSDEGGTRTGRLAASNPNPQQVPSRAEIAPLIRALFIPEEGKKWAKYDYSQQEPRILVHFAYLCKMTGADVVRLAYKDNPNMDIYSFLAESASVTRRESKDITLGRCYGMGARKLAFKLGISEDEAKTKLTEFDRSVPFVREIADRCQSLAQQRGWIKTLCGRKRHFNWWEPANAYEQRERAKQEGRRIDLTPRKLEEARLKWPNVTLKRAHTQKALNSLIQGSAADMTKSVMVAVYEQYGQIPYLQVHDELDYGVYTDQEADKYKVTAETATKTEVPMKIDMTVGEHWK